MLLEILLPILIIEPFFFSFYLGITENSDVYEIDLLLNMLSIMDTLLLDLRNSSSGSY